MFILSRRWSPCRVQASHIGGRLKLLVSTVATRLFWLLNLIGIGVLFLSCDSEPEFVPKCVGTVSTCSSLSNHYSACDDQNGCYNTPARCRGREGGCMRYDYQSCEDYLGCDQNHETMKCDGAPLECAQYYSQTSCDQRAYCSWTPAHCEGTARACDFFNNKIYCDRQWGCWWEDGS